MSMTVAVELRFDVSDSVMSKLTLLGDSPQHVMADTRQHLATYA
jgi:hypothetical protein